MNPTSAESLHALGLTQGAQMCHPTPPPLNALQTTEPLKRFRGISPAGFSLPSPPHRHHRHLYPPGLNGEQEAIWPCAALCSHQCCVCLFTSGAQTPLIYVNWNCTGRFFPLPCPPASRCEIKLALSSPGAACSPLEQQKPEHAKHVDELPFFVIFLLPFFPPLPHEEVCIFG